MAINTSGITGIFSVGNLSATPAGVAASANFGSGINTLSAGLPLIVLVIVAIGVMFALILALADWNRFRQMQNLLGWFIRTFDYFLYGLLTIIVVGIPVAIIYFLGGSVESNPQILYWIAGVIGAFFAISGLGWIMKSTYRKINKNVERLQKLNTPKVTLSQKEVMKNLKDQKKVE